jgi:hypothetical protein
MKKLVLAVIVLAMGVSLASANLLLNPSFETEGAAGFWEPANWARSDDNDRTETASWGAEWVYDGSYVMNLNMTGGLPTDHTLNQDVSVVMDVADVITFSFFAFANDNAVFSDAYVDIGLTGGSGGDDWHSISFASALSNQTYASGWVEHSMSVTNQQADADGISVWVNVKGFDDTAGNANVMFDSANLNIPEPSSLALIGLGAFALRLFRRKRNS